MLTSLILHRHGDTGWQVCQTNSRFCFVDVLIRRDSDSAKSTSIHPELTCPPAPLDRMTSSLISSMVNKLSSEGLISASSFKGRTYVP